MEIPRKMDTIKMMFRDQARKDESNYHFNPRRRDLESEVITRLGKLNPRIWWNDLDDIIKNSKSATWHDRGYNQAGTEFTSRTVSDDTDYLGKIGLDPDYVITNLNWDIPESLRPLCDNFALENSMIRIHVQTIGQVWTRHIDDLKNFCPEDPKRITRIFIHLTDWMPGQFWEFGTYHYSHWRAGDVMTFDWPNMPHGTANAGHWPRVTLQLTGLMTDGTHEYLRELQKSL